MGNAREAVARAIYEITPARMLHGPVVPDLYYRMADAAIAALPARCCVCGNPVDTREEAEGGSPDGAELSDGRWVCSGGCWDVADLPARKPVVKPLEWQDHGCGIWSGGAIGMVYCQISYESEYHFELDTFDNSESSHTTLEAAKAAAQADYRARILSALEPAREPSVAEAEEHEIVDQHLGDVCCYSFDGVSMEPDIDGAWCRFEDAKANVLRALSQEREAGNG